MENSLAGEKNIYYQQAGVVSPDLLSFPGNSRGQLNPEAIYDFLLFGTILPPQTIFSDIHSLFPGESLAADGSKTNQPFQELASLKPLAEPLDYFVSQLDNLLAGYFDNLRSHGQKIGLFLSGGVDSGLLASYLKPSDACVSWAGWGPSTSDYLSAKTIAKAFHLENHLVVLPDYGKDEELFVSLTDKFQEPFKLTALPYFLMAEKLQAFIGGKVFCLTGDNADTAAGSFGEVVHIYQLRRLNKFLKYFPWRWLSSFYRKAFLLSTDNPVALSAWFHSNGIFPGPWLRLPPKYFCAKLSLLEDQLAKKVGDFNDYILMGLLLIGVVRQMSGLRSIIYRRLDVEFGLPYCDPKIMALFLQVPLNIRQADHYGKIILKQLALKRGVPPAVVAKKKKGISYGYRDYLSQKRHLPLWEAMARNKLLNDFIDIKMIRQKHQDNFFVFDSLRSLHYYLLTFN